MTMLRKLLDKWHSIGDTCCSPIEELTIIVKEKSLTNSLVLDNLPDDREIEVTYDVDLKVFEWEYKHGCYTDLPEECIESVVVVS